MDALCFKMLSRVLLLDMGNSGVKSLAVTKTKNPKATTWAF
jgi:hypothetical protein